MNIVFQATVTRPLPTGRQGLRLSTYSPPPLDGGACYIVGRE
jgi:hypothetical protein